MSVQKILLDTHCFLWILSKPDKLGRKARKLVESPDIILYLSVVSAWEISIKYSLKKLKLPEIPTVFVPSRIELLGLVELPIYMMHAVTAGALPGYHSDPFDRLLIAQAQIENIPLLTADSVFSKYKVECISSEK